MLFTELEVEQIKELFEKVHNNEKLSEIENVYLNDKGLVIYNNGSSVDLIQMWVKVTDSNWIELDNWEDKILVSIPYYTIWDNTQKDWIKVDEAFEKITIKS